MTKKKVDFETGTITFTFDDESSETFDIAKVNAETRAKLELHGASQKIGDSYAGAKDAADPLAFAKESVRDTIAQLYAGDWRVSATGGPRVSDLATAVAAVTGKTVEEATALIAEYDEAQRKALRKHPKVAATLAAISAKKAAEKAARLAESANEGDPLAL